MATQKKSARRTSRKSNESTPWIVVVVVLAFLLIWSFASSITRVDVGTVQSDLAAMQAQLTAQAAETEAPATEEAPAATDAPVETEAPKATEEAVAEAPAQPAPAEDRIAKLIKLDETYRSQGWEAWLRAAGISFDSSKVESRQPVEEVLSGHVTVTGLVIRATGLEVSWPSCITTDRPNEVTTSASTRQHQPDLRNPSVLYTNAVLNGQATVYADCSDWGQLDP